MPEAKVETFFPLNYFIETKQPPVNSKEWGKLNRTKFEFNVTNKDNKLIITRGTKGPRCELKIPTGKLVGMDNGDLGGKLTFKPSDATKPTIEVKKGNIKFIFLMKDVIYFIEGIANFEKNEGSMYQLDIVGDVFKPKKVMTFEDAPEAFAIFNGSLLIASYNNFYRVTDLNKETLLKGLFWNGLFPTSIAPFDDTHIYIGLRSGYAKMDLTTNKLTFYRYEIIQL
jgi:hypothetical protein